MRSVALVSVVTLAVVAPAQTQNPAKLPTLGPVSPVDFHVKSIQWHPRGDSVLYTRKEGAGNAVGVYMPGQDQGKVVVHLQSGDTSESEWLAGTNQAVSIVYRHEQENGKPMRRLQVYLVNAEAQDSKLIFNRSYPLELNPDFDVDTSPKLLHAIFRLKTVVEKKRVTEHYILKTGAQELTPCPDLDAAVAKGLSGPSWSLDGTAVFHERSGNQILADVPIVGRLLDAQRQDAEQKVLAQRGGAGAEQNARIATIELALDQAKINRLVDREGGILRLDSGTLKWIATPPPPPTGSVVLELMPQNGVIRQVRFQGPWVEQEVKVQPVNSASQPYNLEFGRSRGQGVSLWLTSADPKAAQSGGLLVAASATNAWLSPRHSRIAYLSEGTLYMRAIERK